MSSEMIEPPFIQMKGSERKMVLPTSPPPVMAKPDLPSLVSFVAASTSSAQVCGGLGGVEAGGGEVALVEDDRVGLDPVGDRPELAVPGHVVERRRHIVVAVLEHVVERQDQVVLGVAVHPAVLHVDDVGRGARLQRRQHPLRQAVGGGDLEPHGDAGVLRLELGDELAGARLVEVRRPPDDLAGRRPCRR